MTSLYKYKMIDTSDISNKYNLINERIKKINKKIIKYDTINHKFYNVPIIRAGIICINVSYEDIFNRGKFFLVKNTHKWGFPKGHIEPGESYYECACREFYEETGIPAAFEHYKYFYINMATVYFITFTNEFTSNIENIISKDEITDNKWIAYNDINTLNSQKNTNIGVSNFYKLWTHIDDLTYLNVIRAPATLAFA